MKKLFAILMVLTLISTAALADSMSDAMTAAQQLVGEQAVLVESESDDGIYEFQFRDDSAKYDVNILPSGDVLSFETEYAGLVRAKQAGLTEQDARDKVQAAFPDAEIHLILAERDDDDGHTFEVFLTNNAVPTEISLNAETGDILRIETFPAAQGIANASMVSEWISTQSPGAVLTELELEYDDGRYVYEGEATVNGALYSYKFSADNGILIEWELD